MLCFRFFFQMKESLLWTIVPFLAIILSLEAVTGNKVGVRNYLFFFPSSFVIDHLFHHYIIRLSDDTILDLQHSIEKRLIPIHTTILSW